MDVGISQEKKYNQNAFGDYFISKRLPLEESLIAVLSDGLGSGIKANILATMTATMLLRFVEKNFNLQKAAEIIMGSLPVCRVRQISYATFSVVKCDEVGTAHIVEEGNPDFIWMRGKELMKAPFQTLTCSSRTNLLTTINRKRYFNF
jgi:hypothetical protein